MVLDKFEQCEDWKGQIEDNILKVIDRAWICWVVQGGVEQERE